MMSDNTPIMFQNNPGFEKCLEIFKIWNKHQSLDFSAQHISVMKSCHTESLILDSFFTEDEFEELRNYLVYNPVPHLFWEGGSTLTNINPDFPNYERIMELTVDRFRELRGYFEVDNVFVRKAVNSLPLHTDNVYNFDDRIPAKTFVIPLAVEREEKFIEDWQNVSTIIFNQFQYLRAYGAEVFDVDGLTGNEFLDEYYDLVSHHTKQELFGLSIEKILNWKQRNVFEFDSYRLHCSSNWITKGPTAKWGLMVQTSTRIPNN